MAKQWVSRTECPSCVERGSEHYYQNLWVDSEGGTYCFVCNTHHNMIKHKKTFDLLDDKAEPMRPMIDGKFAPLNKRKISEEVCRRGKTQVGEYNGRPCIIFNHIGWQKLKFVDEQDPPYISTGECDSNHLFLKELWNPDPNRGIVITEGEIDALTVMQTLQSMAVVSLPSGACKKGVKAARVMEANLDYLLGFKEVILGFDMDEAGIASTEASLKTFTSGRVRVIQWTRKDANDMLKKGEDELIRKCVWNAKVHREDVVKKMSSESLNKDREMGESLPYPMLNKALRGLPRGGLFSIVGPPGCGKSTVTYDLIYKYCKDQIPVGLFALENIEGEVARKILTRHTGERWDEPSSDGLLPLVPDELLAEFDELVKSVTIYDDHGALDPTTLLTRIKQMVHRDKCRVVIIDNLSDVASSLGKDERVGIDKLQSDLKRLCKELHPLTVIQVIHVSKPPRSSEKDRGYDQGRPILIEDIRGSNGYAQSSKTIVAVQPSTDDNRSSIVVLKNNRPGAKKGDTFPMVYVETHDTLQESVTEL